MTLYKVPIGKTAPGTFIEIDSNDIPEGPAWEAVIMAGLQAIAEQNKTSKAAGLTGVSKLVGKELAEAHARSLAISQENFANLLAGKVKAKRGAKSDDTLPRDVQTEARRLARSKVADIIRDAGLPQNAYTAKQKTEAADAYIKENPDIVALAKDNLAVAKTIPVGSFNITAFAAPDAEKVAEAKEKKAAAAAKKASKPLSAKQAGMTTKRAKKSADIEAKPNSPEAKNADLLAALAAEKAASTASRTHGQPVH